MISFIKKNSNLRSENLIAFLFLLPSLILFVTLILVPAIFSLILSFTKWDFISGFSTIKFVGIKNFINLFNDQWFTDSFINNLIFTVTVIPISLFLSLVLAVIINKFSYFKNVLKAMIFMPYISSIVAISVVWMIALHPSFGPVNEMLKAIGVANPPKWFADMNWALPAIIFISIWQGLGYYLVVYIAGLNAISSSIYESADIDGASFFQKFFKITIPLVSPTTFFLAITGIVGSFKVFDIISVLTEGGPGTSTSMLAYYIYKSAFEYHRMGYASAISWILFLVMFIVTVIQWRGQKKWVTYE
jgi:multiple sugar transport system permease protein